MRLAPYLAAAPRAYLQRQRGREREDEREKEKERERERGGDREGEIERNKKERVGGEREGAIEIEIDDEIESYSITEQYNMPPNIYKQPIK